MSLWVHVYRRKGKEEENVRAAWGRLLQSPTSAILPPRRRRQMPFRSIGISLPSSPFTAPTTCILKYVNSGPLWNLVHFLTGLLSLQQMDRLIQISRYSSMPWYIYASASACARSFSAPSRAVRKDHSSKGVSLLTFLAGSH